MIISIAIQKGGTGKTTTAFNLSAALAKQNNKVLLVSLDSQKNLNEYVGFKSDGLPDIFDLICALVNNKAVPVEQSIRYLESENIDYIPSSEMLVTAVSMLGASNAARIKNDMVLDRLFMLPEFDKYDYIILDCSPSLDLLVINALNASDGVIIPAIAEVFGVQGITPTLDLVEAIRDTTNIGLQITGILPTMIDSRTSSGKGLLSFVSEKYKDVVFETWMPRLPAEAANSVMTHNSLVNTKGSRLGARYEDLASEVIKRNK